MQNGTKKCESCGNRTATIQGSHVFSTPGHDPPYEEAFMIIFMNAALCFHFTSCYGKLNSSASGVLKQFAYSAILLASVEPCLC